MPREKPAYRDQLEALTAHFGGAGIVTQTQVAAYLGRTPRWVRDRLNVRADGVTLPILARRLLDLCGE